ncbi:hypothetical protein LPJ62_006200, partial [Coemansia sp. RSA 2167]
GGARMEWSRLICWIWTTRLFATGRFRRTRRAQKTMNWRMTLLSCQGRVLILLLNTARTRQTLATCKWPQF